MNKSRTKNNFKFFLFILVICLVAFGGVYLFNKDGDLADGLSELFGDNSSLKDNYNGVYLYEQSIGNSTSMFRGCSLDHIDLYIVIVDDLFYTYRSSCIGTFPFESGKVKDLDIFVNEESNNYYIKYNDLVYTKDLSIRHINIENNVAEYGDKFYVNNYELLFRESQFPGGYFNIQRLKIANLSNDMFIEFKHVDGERFDISLTNKENVLLYTYSFPNFDYMPMLYPYGGYLVILEKNELAHKYSNNIIAIGVDGPVYNLYDYFPIAVNGVVIDSNFSIFATFDKYDRKFKVFFSKDKNICVEDSDSTDVAYYEFVVDYDYAKKNFAQPEFVRQGLKNEGCNYINEILGR